MSRVASSTCHGTPTKIDEGIPITLVDLFHRVWFVPSGEIGMGLGSDSNGIHFVRRSGVCSPARRWESR
jgi:hypothetical protein